MATMPSRADTAPQAIASLLSQVDRLWLFLDRFAAVPSYARHERLRVLRSQEVGDMHANGKFAGLFVDQEPCAYFAGVDDIESPVDYCETLGRELRRHRGAAVGVHAAVLHRPVTSYARDMKVLHRRSAQARAAGVDLLGSDSLAFHTDTLSFDVRAWPDVNMVDLSFALEARRRGVPLVMIARAAHWLRALAEDQEDSIWAGVLRDDTRQTKVARELAALPRQQLPRRGARRLSYRSA